MKKYISIVSALLVGCGGGATTGPLIEKDIETIGIIAPTNVSVPTGTVYYQGNSVYETEEYLRSNTLISINASAAYERGYTGKNGLIAILDTGIDNSSTEFKNKIVAATDFSGSGTIIDRNGHGTHIAGIAAANKNGIGVHGVAYDAKLIIGKITDNGSLSVNNIINGVNWANQNNADVANLSGGWALSQTYLNAQKISDGIYQTKFTNTGTIPLNEIINVSDWANVSKGEMVLVFSAGNDKKPWSQALASLATIVDSNNKLLLDGRIIIAGNYDPVKKALNPYSNGAAHLCQKLINNVCQDTYKTYDFYLMAPGTNIISTYPYSTPGLSHPIDPTTGEPATLVSMTGTSMAAPVISGAVTIIREMWPQMTGSNIVKLLLLTANKDIPNYNLFVHGQGLLDLEKATRPYGNLGVPTTGRLMSSQTASMRPLVYTNGSASTGGISRVLLLDDFSRDFYVNGKYLTAHNAKRTNVKQSSYFYTNLNGYSLLNDYSKRVNTTINDINFGYLQDSKNYMINVDYTFKVSDVKFKFNYNYFSESDTWLGNSLGSFLNNAYNLPSQTNVLGFQFDKNITNNIKLFGSYNLGFTNTNSYSDNVLNIRNITSDTYAMGAEYNIDKTTLGVMYYKPVTVKNAIAKFNVPVGLDKDFNIKNEIEINMKPTVVENRISLYYKYIDNKQNNLLLFVEKRINFTGQKGIQDNIIGLYYTKYINK